MMVVLAAAVLQLAGCFIGTLLMVPLQLIFGLFAAIGGTLAGIVSISDVPPDTGPPPSIIEIAPDRWMVDGLRIDQPCTITCSAPGYAPRTYAWPRDFAGHGVDVAAILQRSE